MNANKYTRLVVIPVLSVLLFFVLVGNSGAATPSCLNGPVWLVGAYDTSILSAYNNENVDSTFYIEGTTYYGKPFTEHLIFSGKDITIRLLGGYTCDFQTQDDYSAINGFLFIDSGTVEMSNIVLTSIPQYLVVQSSNPANGVPVYVNINGLSSLSVGTPNELTVSNGDLVSLTTPSYAQNGFPFDSWSGCDNTTGNICNVTMTSSRTVSANYYSADPAGTVLLQQSTEAAVILNGGDVQFFKFTTPAGGCSASANQWLVVTLINVNLAAGDGQLLIKSSNHGQSSWPTLADYTYLFGLYGYSLGSDWTRDPNGGVFFWRWDLGAASESLAILPSYAGHNFSQDDTYYLLLYNQGAVQNQYRVLWRCS